MTKGTFCGSIYAFHTTNHPHTETFIMPATLPPSQAALPTGGSIAAFVGVDLHKCTVSLAAVNPAGEVMDRLKISTKCRDTIMQWLAKLPQPIHLAVEACPFVEWFIDAYRPMILELGGRFDIADATELASRRGKRRKSDRNDSTDIAERLARGDCPLGWIADDELANLRKLGRQWHRLSRILSRAKHTMRSMLLAVNVNGPGELSAAAGQKWLLAHGQLLKTTDYHSFGELLDIVALVERQRAGLKRRIIDAGRQERFAPLIQRLKSVKGIDVIWSCILLAEIGDFARFPNADALEFWAGLTPDNEESAGRTTSGHITKAGSRTLRWALCKAAVTLCRSDADQEAHRQRLIQRTGVKAKANVAMGRRLLRILYAMMRDGADYRAGRPTDHPRRANQVRAARQRNRRTQTPHTRSHATAQP